MSKLSLNFYYTFFSFFFYCYCTFHSYFIFFFSENRSDLSPKTATIAIAAAPQSSQFRQIEFFHSVSENGKFPLFWGCITFCCLLFQLISSIFFQCSQIQCVYIYIFIFACIVVICRTFVDECLCILCLWGDPQALHIKLLRQFNIFDNFMRQPLKSAPSLRTSTTKARRPGHLKLVSFGVFLAIYCDTMGLYTHTHIQINTNLHKIFSLFLAALTFLLFCLISFSSASP